MSDPGTGRVTQRYEEGALTGYRPAPELRIEPGFSCVALEVMNTELQGTIFVLEMGTSVLGRALEADHMVLHPTVSRRHCSVTVTKNAVMVRDEGSAHGVLLNGATIQEAYLKERDLLQLGDVAMMVDVRFLRHLAKREKVRHAGDHRGG